MSRLHYVYNLKFERKDGRDKQLSSVVAAPAKLPTSFSLVNDQFPAVLDQGQLGSCTAQATSNALRHCLRKEGKPDCQPSRLFIYYYSRLLENCVNQDSGAVIRDVMKAVQKYGACDESSGQWPYDITKFKQQPPRKCVDLAKQHMNVRYYAVEQSLVALKSALVAGFPIVCGIMIYESFERDETMSTGHVPLPDYRQGQESLYGGHAILLVGYNDDTREFIFENSWGTGVGDHGYFYIPYNFITNPNLANDFWTLTWFE